MASMNQSVEFHDLDSKAYKLFPSVASQVQALSLILLVVEQGLARHKTPFYLRSLSNKLVSQGEQYWD